jgi:transposase
MNTACSQDSIPKHVVQDPSLLEAIIRLPAPWRIERAELRLAPARVDVWVGHSGDGFWPCPECRLPLPVQAAELERVWRHLDWCQFQTFVHAKVPRVACPRHALHEIAVPWAEAGSRYTSAMQRWIVDLSECTGLAGVSRVLRLDWTETVGIMLRTRDGV